MNTYKKGTSEALSHDIYIWIGSESTQDEYGTAAYKMVEADDYLGGQCFLLVLVAHLGRSELLVFILHCILLLLIKHFSF
jgi:hypothetical protein